MNVKLSNSQLNKLKSAIKNGTDIVLRLSSNMVGNSDDETNFPHKLLLTNRQTLSLRKAFNNHTSADIKFSKAQLTKMLGDLLTKNLSGRGVIRAGEGAIRAGEGTIEAGYGSKKILTPHPLTNFEIQTNYQNEPRFTDVYSRDNLPYKVKNGACVINFDEYSDIGTHWIALYVNNKTVRYFDSFGIEHIPKEVKKFIGNRNIISNIYRIQNYGSIMFGYFYIGFIDYMFKGNSLTDYTNLFSHNNFKKNDDIISNYFLNKL